MLLFFYFIVMITLSCVLLIFFCLFVWVYFYSFHTPPLPAPFSHLGFLCAAYFLFCSYSFVLFIADFFYFYFIFLLFAHPAISILELPQFTICCSYFVYFVLFLYFLIQCLALDFRMTFTFVMTLCHVTQKFCLLLLLSIRLLLWLLNL